MLDKLLLVLMMLGFCCWIPIIFEIPGIEEKYWRLGTVLGYLSFSILAIRYIWFRRRESGNPTN